MKYLGNSLFNLASWLLALCAVSGVLIITGFVIGLFYSLVHLGWAVAVQLFSKT